MRDSILKWIVTVGAIILAIVHFIRPDLTIDPVTLGLLIVAVLPWLSSLFKSLELPGGWKIEFQDVRAAGEKITGANPPPETERPTPRPAYLEIAGRDPNLALVGLGIEIERRLRALAERYNIDAQRASMMRLFQELKRQGVLNDPSVSGLHELIAARNQAAHGARVEPEVALWAFEVGPDILAVLDAKLEQ